MLIKCHGRMQITDNYAAHWCVIKIRSSLLKQKFYILKQKDNCVKNTYSSFNLHSLKRNLLKVEISSEAFGELRRILRQRLLTNFLLYLRMFNTDCTLKCCHNF